MDTKRTGYFGERIAENYLRKKGYQILDRNYAFRIPGSPQKGEIDIVVQKSGIISFVEVKLLRNPAALISPEEKVNFSKQRKLVKTAETWLLSKKIPLNSKWQIDVIAIGINPNGKVEINHFENAIPYF